MTHNLTKLNFTTPVEWRLTRAIMQKVIQKKKHAMFFTYLNMIRKIIPVTQAQNDSLTHIVSYTHGI